MTVNKIELQDSLGNIIYPHTNGDIVDYDNNSSVVEKINDLQEKLNILKANLATVVNNKAGSSLTSDSTIQEVINEINSITTLLDSTKDATATANQILNNQTAYINGLKVTGSMVNNGTVSPLVNCGEVYTIPEGYHNGSGKVTANSLANQTSDATAGTLQIVPPYTAYVNGLKVTGSMNVMSVDSTNGTNFHSNATNCEYGTYSSGDSNPYLYLGIPQWSYTTKNGFVRTPASTVASKLGITADKIASGNTICGIAGTATASKNVATLTLTDINLVTTTADGSGLRFSVDLSAYLNGLSSYIVECSGTCYAYSTSTVASYAVVTPYSSFIKYKDSYAGDTFKVEVPDPTKIVFYRRTNSTYKCTSINFTVRITSF